MSSFNCFYQQGNLSQARLFCEGNIKDHTNPSGEDLLWALQLGAVARAQKDYQQSNLWLDRAEEMLKTYDLQARQGDVVGTTIVNDNVIPYRGCAYDGIMVNTYKALNFMVLGQNEYARVEFNRAMERQMRARERFNEEIRKKKDKLEKANTNKNFDYKKTTENPDVDKRIRQAYPGLYDFQAYPDFVNPFSTYLAGVFFLVTGDSAKAVDLLKESRGMLPDNSCIAKDHEDAEKHLNTGKPIEPAVWVFFENGLGPVKEEYRVDLPLFLFTGKVYYAGMALPKLAFRGGAAEKLTISSADGQYPTQIAGDMDRVIQTEFAKEYPWIITRALLAAGVKGAAQYSLLENDNSSAKLAGALVALYSLATTAADVRIWTALPKNFGVARLPMPQDGKITIQLPHGGGYPVEIKSCRYAIVYIKMISAATDPLVEVITY